MARMPSPIWTMTYAAPEERRRKHRHRCRVCNIILKGGEKVLAARVRGGNVKVIHEACGDLRILPDQPFTHRELLEAHGLEYLAGCGWADAKRLTSVMAIFKPGQMATAKGE